MRIKIKKFRDVELPEAFNGDWVDLRIAQDIKATAGDPLFVPLGVGMILTEGTEAHLLPRSSTFKKTGLMLANGMGIIDNNYSGDDDEWGAWFYPTRDIEVPAGTRLLQFRIMDTQHTMFGDVAFEEVEHLNDESRGGFGSTGN